MKSIIIIAVLLGYQVGWSQGKIDGRYELKRYGDPLSFETAENWVTTNSLCTAIGITPNVEMSDDACSGNFALKLETSADTACMPFPAAATCKNEITFRPEKLTGYYKADFKGNDYAGVKVTLHNDRGLVGWGALDIDYSTNIYSWFEVPIHYLNPAVMPDSFVVSVYSSQGNEVSGTVIYMDDLAFEAMADVTIPMEPVMKTRITPNPAVDEILVDVPEELGMVLIRIFDEAGQPRESEEFIDQIRIPVYNYTQGMYMYEIWLANRQMYDRGRFVVGKRGL